MNEQKWGLGHSNTSTCEKTPPRVRLNPAGTRRIRSKQATWRLVPASLRKVSVRVQPAYRTLLREHGLHVSLNRQCIRETCSGLFVPRKQAFDVVQLSQMGFALGLFWRRICRQPSAFAGNI